MTLLVTSRQNRRVKELRAGLSRGGRTATGQIAVEGLHLVQEAAKSGLRLHTVLVRAGSEGLLEQVELGGAEVLIVSGELFASAAATEQPQGIAALVEAPVFAAGALLKGTPLVVVAGGLQDPGNLGTLIRSAEAFGASGMILLPGTVSVWNGKALRASAGSAFRLPVVTLGWEEAAEFLRQHAVRIVAAVAREGVSMTDLRGASALLIGNEGAGLPAEWIAQADERVTIPCPGVVESLNAAVAGSVLLYEAMRQRLGSR